MPVTIEELTPLLEELIIQLETLNAAIDYLTAINLETLCWIALFVSLVVGGFVVYLICKPIYNFIKYY